jgi:uncharacterized protein DUF6318
MNELASRMRQGTLASTRRGIATTLAVSVVAGGALSGCNDADSEPPDSGLPANSELTESPTSPDRAHRSPTDPTPSGPPEPRLPTAAKAPGKAGAKAFVAYYIRLLNYAQHTGEASRLRQYGDSCRGCKAYARLAEKTYQNGGWFRGGSWTPDPRSWFVDRSGAGYFVAVTVEAAKGRQLPRKSAEVTRFLADTYRLNFQVESAHSTWQVARLASPA